MLCFVLGYEFRRLVAWLLVTCIVSGYELWKFISLVVNDPTIGSYNNYHVSPNGIPRGSRGWYGRVYFVYKNAGSPKGKA